MATVIASQAVISGAFSLTQQAIQLGYAPRFDIHHTSEHEKGQVYIPEINWLLMVATVGLVFGFRIVHQPRRRLRHGGDDDDGDHDAAGLRRGARAVALGPVARRPGDRRRFSAIDLAFFGANVIKIQHGGWFPLSSPPVCLRVMSTWKRAASSSSKRLARVGNAARGVLQAAGRNPPVRVPWHRRRS